MYTLENKTENGKEINNLTRVEGGWIGQVGEDVVKWDEEGEVITSSGCWWDVSDWNIKKTKQQKEIYVVAYYSQDNKRFFSIVFTDRLSAETFVRVKENSCVFAKMTSIDVSEQGE